MVVSRRVLRGRPSMQAVTSASGRDSTGTPLVTAFRESCGYLRDADYHQTAQLMTVASDETERLNGALRARDPSRQNPMASVIGRVRQELRLRILDERRRAAGHAPHRERQSTPLRG